MILDEFCIASTNLSRCLFPRFLDLPKVLRELKSSKVGKNPQSSDVLPFFVSEGVMKTFNFIRFVRILSLLVFNLFSLRNSL